MPYRVDLTPIDLGHVFGAAGPTITGTLAGKVPGTSTKLAPDTAVPIPGAPPTSVLFPAATSGGFPANEMVLSDAGAASGQVFRSGEIALPASPGQVTLYTAVGAITKADIDAFGASLGGAQFSTDAADWLRVVLGLLGFVPPETATITSATITPVSPDPTTTPPTEGHLSIAVTGSVTYRAFYFVSFTQPFTISTNVTIAPSGDGMRTDRIVSVVPTGTTLSLGGTAPPLPFAMFNGTLVDRLEPTINRAIVNAVDAKLRARMPPMGRTPTCVISARRVDITNAEISAQIMLADFGPAVAALPRRLALSVTPAPVPKVQRAYTFRVVDPADQSPVVGATVALTNRNPTTIQTHLTDAQGEATFTVTLRTDTVGGLAHLEEDPRVLQPYAVATAPGAQATTLALILDEPV